MAKPLKRPGATPAPATTPAPAPAPAPAAAKPAPAAPAAEEERRRAEKREERIEEKKPSSKPAAASPAAATGAVETPAAEKVGRRGPLAAVGIGPPVYEFTEDPTQPVFGPQAPDPYQAQYDALARVADLRRQGKIGEQQSSFGGGYATPFLLTSFLSGEGARRPAIRPVQVQPKVGREPLVRRPYASQVEMPTAEELDIRALGAQKMQQVMRDREASMRQQEQNDQERKQLERRLTQPDPTKSIEAQATPIHRRLKEIAKQQRQIAEQVAAQESTLREYGMTDEEIKSR